MLKRTISKVLVLAMALSGIAAVSAAQTPEQKPAFEVASIKLNTITAAPSRTLNEGGLIYTNVALAEYIELAYGLKYRQLSGPEALYQDRYDITAKTSGPETPDTIKLMVRALLENRFQMRFHREDRETAVNALVLGKNGPAFRAAAGDGPLERRLTQETFQLHNASMADLAEFINTVGDRFVVDKTGLQGHYDLDLKLYDLSAVSKTTPIQETKRSLFDALTVSLPSALQSLGLKLEPQKAQVEFMIVDAMQRPSEN